MGSVCDITGTFCFPLSIQNHKKCWFLKYLLEFWIFSFGTWTQVTSAPLFRILSFMWFNIVCCMKLLIFGLHYILRLLFMRFAYELCYDSNNKRRNEITCLMNFALKWTRPEDRVVEIGGELKFKKKMKNKSNLFFFLGGRLIREFIKREYSIYAGCLKTILQTFRSISLQVDIEKVFEGLYNIVDLFNFKNVLFLLQLL